MEGGKGGREGGADTELKTKTPHVNVGNKQGKVCDLLCSDDE